MLIKVNFEELQAKINLKSINSPILQKAFDWYMKNLEEAIKGYNSNISKHSFEQNSPVIYLDKIKKIVEKLKEMKHRAECSPQLTDAMLSTNVTHILNAIEPAIYGALLKYDEQFSILELGKVISLYEQGDFKIALNHLKKMIEFIEVDIISGLLLVILNKLVDFNDKSDLFFLKTLEKFKATARNQDDRSENVQTILTYAKIFFAAAPVNKKNDVYILIDNFLAEMDITLSKRDFLFGTTLMFSQENESKPRAEEIEMAIAAGQSFRASILSNKPKVRSVPALASAASAAAALALDDKKSEKKFMIKLFEQGDASEAGIEKLKQALQSGEDILKTNKNDIEVWFYLIWLNVLIDPVKKNGQDELILNLCMERIAKQLQAKPEQKQMIKDLLLANLTRLELMPHNLEILKSVSMVLQNFYNILNMQDAQLSVQMKIESIQYAQQTMSADDQQKFLVQLKSGSTNPIGTELLKSLQSKLSYRNVSGHSEQEINETYEMFKQENFEDAITFCKKMIKEDKKLYWVGLAILNLLLHPEERNKNNELRSTVCFKKALEASKDSDEFKKIIMGYASRLFALLSVENRMKVYSEIDNFFAQLKFIIAQRDFLFGGWLFRLDPSLPSGVNVEAWNEENTQIATALGKTLRASMVPNVIQQSQKEVSDDPELLAAIQMSLSQTEVVLPENYPSPIGGKSLKAKSTDSLTANSQTPAPSFK